MGPTEQTLTPVAVALHTRDRKQDYRWYLEVGHAVLVGQLKGLHRELIADQDAKPAATFLLLEQGERVGLLVANLKTERPDHQRTCIDDTLILEFSAKDRNMVYRLAAGLLGVDSGDVLHQLLEYAEARFQDGGAGTMKPLTVPLSEHPAGKLDFPSEPHVALRSNEPNQRRVVDLLHRTAVGQATVELPFILVSTGLVGKDKLQQQAPMAKRFIALSRSSSIPGNKDVSLKKKAMTKPLMFKTLCAGLVALSLSGWALLGWKAPTDPHNNSAKKTSDSAKKTPDFAKKTPDFAKNLPEGHTIESRWKLARAAGAAGIGAAWQGDAGLLVVTALLADAVR